MFKVTRNDNGWDVETDGETVGLVLFVMAFLWVWAVFT
jgi:hypothetical protein